MRISVTELELYSRCPRAFKLNVLEEVMPERKKLSQCTSNTARRVILLTNENKHVFTMTKEKLLELCDQVWQEEIADPRVDMKELEYIVQQEKPETKNRQKIPAVTKAQKALDEVKVWCLGYWMSEMGANVVANNVFFEDKIGDVIFHGYIDQIRQNKDGVLEIVMFNSSSQAPHHEYLMRDFSLSLYSHAVWQGKLFPELNLPETKNIPHFYVYYLPHLESFKRNGKVGKKGEMKGNPMIPAHRTKKALLDFEYEVLEVAAGIREQFFPMRTCNPCGCSICPYAYKCKSATSEIVVPEYVESFGVETE